MCQSIPRVYCVILNWNNYLDTSECIDSLQQLSYENFEVIIVDNGSTDGSGKRLRQEYDDVTVLFTERNLGFGGGNNRGIRSALERGADYVWILNDDVLLSDAKCLDVLVKRMESKPKIGALTPVVTEYPETDEVWFREGYVDWRSGNAGHVGSSKWFVDWRFRSETDSEDSLVSHDYLPLCSALIRAEVFQELGLLREDYFLYYEDVDLCTRTGMAGYEIATETTVAIHHKVSASSDHRRSPTHLYYTARNWQLYRRYFDDDLFSWHFFPLYAWWAIVTIISFVLRGDWRVVTGLLLGIWDGVLGKAGKGRYP